MRLVWAIRSRLLVLLTHTCPRTASSFGPRSTTATEVAGIPATGRRISVRIACLYEFEKDRLVCERVWFDFATILRQLGVLAS